MNSASAFREVLQNAFGPLPWEPVPDGVIHRFHVPGDPPASAHGWYVLDGAAAGAFGSWKAGGTWCGQTLANRRASKPPTSHPNARPRP